MILPLICINCGHMIFKVDVVFGEDDNVKGIITTCQKCGTQSFYKISALVNTKVVMKVKKRE